MVAENPTAGTSLGGGIRGGIRKMRVARSGGGKKGGARIIFLFSGQDIPVFLLTIFAKNEKANLTPKERATLIAMGKRIIEDYRRHE